MGDIEFGKCDICGRETALERTYFYYPIHCECCGCKVNGQDCHFEMIRHCKDCIPAVPTEIHPLCKDACGLVHKANISNMMPIKIEGQFIINDTIIKKKKSFIE